MTSTAEKLDKLRARIQEPQFLRGEGLSNEVNIHIFSYEAREEMQVSHFISRLKKIGDLACNIIECNLYKILLELCEESGYTDAIAGMEAKAGKKRMLATIQKIFGEAEYIRHIQGMFKEPAKVGDVLMLTGVGDVFPFMRVHSMLDAMQPHFGNIPILVMYPGSYDGTQLSLFNSLMPNAYYRAFNII